MSVRSSWSASFEQRLHRYLPFKMQLIINQNRSTLLSVKGRRFSIHELFLQAPEEVIKELARYAMGKKPKPLLRHFIQTSSVESSRPLKLNPYGEIYDLKKMMDELNSAYFEDSLDLTIGWFGREFKKRRHITFGQYLDDYKAIKIHKMLDDPFYPRFFVAFVVYHEMVHAKVPGYLDERGY